MPRNRTARQAVLGASVRRAAVGQLPGRGPVAPRRRLALGVVVLAAIALITVSYREDGEGPLSSLQNSAAATLHPVTVAADRVAQPFRDAYHWFDSLESAREEAERLRKDNEQLRQQLAQSDIALNENDELRALLELRAGPRFPDDYDGLAASVVARPSEAFSRALVVAVGRKDGVQVDDPVVAGDGLVGVISRVSDRTSRVTLLTDDVSAISAEVVRTGASGIARHRRGPGATLILDRVPKEEVIDVGDRVDTAGWRSQRLSSLYPRGIPIGRVTHVGRADTDLWTQVQIEPFVDFDSLDAVLVLVKKELRQP